MAESIIPQPQASTRAAAEAIHYNTELAYSWLQRRCRKLLLNRLSQIHDGQLIIEDGQETWSFGTATNADTATDQQSDHLRQQSRFKILNFGRE